MKGYENIGTCESDNLIYDSKFPVDIKSIELAAGQGLLERGSLIASVQTIGEVLWSGADGQTADCILCDDVDTGDSGTIVTASAYRSGHFTRQFILTANDTDITATAELELRNGGIYLSNAVL